MNARGGRVEVRVVCNVKMGSFVGPSLQSAMEQPCIILLQKAV